MPTWVWVVLAFLVGPFLFGMGAGLVLVLRLNRWRFAAAVSHLHVGEHQALIVKCLQTMSVKEQELIGDSVRKILRANGVSVPVITTGNLLDFSVVGDQVADPGQRRPA